MTPPTPSPGSTPTPTPSSAPTPSPAAAPWTIAPEPFDSPDAVALWRAYYTEVSDRYYLLHEGRRTAPAELDREIAAHTGAELSPAAGQLLVGRYGGEPAGTAGVRLLDASTAELTRVFVREGVRGRGGAPLLVRAAEDAARALGAVRLVLDTRADLVEARALYTRLGYTETEPYNDAPYADHWFEKTLSPQLS
ncbi:ribosomal protein S18 acetylase RimI-like enzyme [Streptomyces achromogenes]|uniref:Ribosomal protein S18 acetylase RimI-like enzyme n=1 Tax=Streptomyces achromogenes TaxID=67255 RepID=A0ABU0PYM8_STRAH|nr:GNAT family N-acetyltransferase [Streptomyces achromogenes]MDQ0683493.1 ribosomal protein S18 acetylase RimI-like enzyme [Streptomyces achromogenes]